jgi:hypothetical protein
VAFWAHSTALTVYLAFVAAHLFLHLCPEHWRQVQCLAHMMHVVQWARIHFHFSPRIYGTSDEVLEDALDLLGSWMDLGLQVSQFIYSILTLGLTFSLPSTIEPWASLGCNTGTGNPVVLQPWVPQVQVQFLNSGPKTTVTRHHSVTGFCGVRSVVGSQTPNRFTGVLYPNSTDNHRFS